MPSEADTESRLRSLDSRILNAVAGRDPDRQDPIRRLVGLSTCLGSGPVCYPAYAIAFLAWPEGRRLVFLVAMADLIGLAVVVSLKYAARRQRPPSGHVHSEIVPWNVYSFPSGHAVRAFAIAVTLTCARCLWGLVAFPMACVVGLSRLVRVRHYPSDVLAGAIIGTLVALACTRLAGTVGAPW